MLPSAASTRARRRREASMRTPAAFAMLVLFVAGPASAEILYARPDAAAAGARYGWEGEVVPDPMPLESAIEVAKAANGSRALEIRLLHRLGAQETVYSVDLGSFRSALRWHGSADRSLV